MGMHVFRKDVQILRGVAVLMVVLFHLDLVGFKSGFLGVDIFFVISGYLMAVMYDPTKKYDFFIKRIKRLLPAYFAIILLTLFAAMLITTPDEYSQVSNQSIFAAFFMSNFGFWAENSYFDKSAFKPLLHLWSLGVEIQFYLIVPILYGLFRRLKWSIWAVLFLSLFACFLVVGTSPKTAFFWLPFRLWEFLVGFFVAKHISEHGGGRWQGRSYIGGISFFIVLAIALFIPVDGNYLSFVYGHPGLAALGVCFATALVLYFGLPDIIEKNFISSILNKVGDYSYSIYLVHFPIIVLFLYSPFHGTILKASNVNQTLILVLSIFIASILLYQWIEQPFRTTKKPLVLSTVAIACIILSSQLGTIVQKAIVPQNQMLIYQAWFDRSEYRCGKLFRIFHPREIACEITIPQRNPIHKILLVGNSHADSIKTEFAKVANRYRDSAYFMVDNNPLMAGGRITPEIVVASAKAKNIDVIVMHFSPEAVTPNSIAQVVKLAAAQNIGVSFIMPVPVWSEHIPEALIDHVKDHTAMPDQTLTMYSESNKLFLNQLNEIKLNNFKIYQIGNVFCRPKCEVISPEGKPFYFDSGHLTLTGAMKLEPVFSKIMIDIK